MTSHEIPKPSVKRFVRPESVGKGSPGFTYSRPEIKVPDLRRNIGGKVHDPTLKSKTKALSLFESIVLMRIT